MTASIVAVDVGNSAIKLQPFQTHPQRPTLAQQAVTLRYAEGDWAEALCRFRSSLAQPPTPTPTPTRDGHAAHAVADPDACAAVTWRIASVNVPVSDQLRQRVQQRFPGDVLRMITWRDIPLRIDVHQPQVVGIDRLLGGWAAWRRRGDDCVAIDAGSAITVDLVQREGIFRGGAILPGLAMQYRALATGTAALPQLVATREPEAGTDPAELFAGPGRDTTEAIRLGVTAGIVAGITRLAQLYQRNLRRADPLPMVLTGGDALHLASLLPSPLQVVPGLVLEALAELPDHPV